MYKVIIVDDEVIIRVAITNIIKWEEEGYVLLDSFENGVDALEYIKNNQVDLVVTDIKMPLMNGIELMTETNKVSPHTLFIILSAFDEFAYARAALKQGALSYVLKMELSTELVLEIVRNAKEKLDVEVKPEACEVISDKRTKQLEQQDIIRELLFGNRMIVEEQDKEKLEIYGIQIENPNFCVVTFMVDKAEDKQRDVNIMQFLKEILDDESIYATWSGYEEISILFNLPEKQEDVLIGEVKRWIQRVQFTIKQYHNQIPTFYMSGIQRGTKNMPQAYLQAYQTKSTHKYAGNGQIMLYNEMIEHREKLDYRLFSDCVQNIETALEKSDIQSSYEILMELIGTVKESSYVELEHIRYFTSTVIAIFHAYLNQNNISRESFWGEHYQQYDVMQNMNRKADFIAFLYDMLQKIQNMIEEDDGNHIVKQVKRYLKQNYAEDISMSDMARELGISVNYLSALFKKVTGETLKDYRIFLRMEKAMDLLRNSNEQISSIALIVGYDNEQYFSRFFKQKIGCTPSQYRNASRIIE
ncbi:MAG: response regulator [Eubacteriales bacterium]